MRRKRPSTIASSKIKRQLPWRRPIGLAALAVTAVLFGPLALANEAYCAFEIRVTAPDGTAVANVPVSLIRNERATLLNTKTDANGMAKFCDAPLEHLGIAVGFDICGSVLVRHLPPAWPETRRVSVTYADAPCNHFVSAASCLELLRVKDETARPVSGASFHQASPITTDASLTDAFGRLFYRLNKGERLQGVIAKSGLRPMDVMQQCAEDGNIEVTVILPKR